LVWSGVYWNFSGAPGGWIGTRTNHSLNFFTNNSAQQMTLLPNENVGIRIINPSLLYISKKMMKRCGLKVLFLI